MIFAVGVCLSHGHLVFGDSARFVGAYDRCAAESFHGMELVHKSVLTQHSAHSQRKGNGDGGGKSLGNCGNGDGYARHKHIKNRLAPQNARPRNDNADDKAYYGNDPSKLPETLLEGCFLVLDIREHTRNPAHLGAFSRGDDPCGGSALGDYAAAVDDICLAH